MNVEKTTPTVGLHFLIWWTLFAGTTYAFSLLLQAFKTYTLTPDWSHGFALVGSFALVLVTLAGLVYDSYAKEKVKGNIVKPFTPFEWLFSIQYKTLDKGVDPHASVL